MRICVIGPWQAAIGDTLENVAVYLRELGHTITLSSHMNGSALRTTLSTIKAINQHRLERLLFQHDAVLCGGELLDYPAIVKAMGSRPALFVDSKNAFDALRDPLYAANAIILCGSEKRVAQARALGSKKAVMIVFPPFDNGLNQDALKQLSELLGEKGD